REKLRLYGRNYREFSRVIHSKSQSTIQYKDTPWSRIAPSVYARFVTKGSYNEIGFVQVRFLDEKRVRQISSDEKSFFSLNVYSLIANPNDLSVQPLTFSPFLSTTGVLVIPSLLENPVAVAFLLATIINTQKI